MTELLSHAEYKAIVADLDPPRAAFIDGKFQAGRGVSMPTVNPATGEVICEIAACNTEDVDLAVFLCNRSGKTLIVLIAVSRDPEHQLVTPG